MCLTEILLCTSVCPDTHGSTATASTSPAPPVIPPSSQIEDPHEGTFELVETLVYSVH